MTQTSETPTPAEPQEKKLPLGAIITGVIIVIIALGLFMDGRVSYSTTQGPDKLADGSYDAQVWGPAKPITAPDQLVYLARREATDPFALGAADAPITIVEYSDFECPFCAQWANKIEPTLIANYVEQGKVRLEWNDFPVNGENAMAAARAGRAAAEQGRFNEFKKALYQASKDIPGHPNNTLENFVEFAKQAGVPDIDKFTADAQSTKYDEAINNSRDFAIMIGMTGTPTLVVGNTPIPGSDDPKEVTAFIDQQLAAIEAGKAPVTEPGTTDGRDYPDLLAEFQAQRAAAKQQQEQAPAEAPAK